MNSVICVPFYIPTQTYAYKNCIKLESELHQIDPTEGTARKPQSQGTFACLVTRAGLQTGSKSDPEHVSDCK